MTCRQFCGRWVLMKFSSVLKPWMLILEPSEDHSLHFILGSLRSLSRTSSISSSKATSRWSGRCWRRRLYSLNCTNNRHHSTRNLIPELRTPIETSSSRHCLSSKRSTDRLNQRSKLRSAKHRISPVEIPANSVLLRDRRSMGLQHLSDSRNEIVSHILLEIVPDMICQ